jgi:hypothetical protein
MNKIFYLLLPLLLFGQTVFAQKAVIKGSVLDSVEMKKLQYSNIVLIRKADSVIVNDTRADADGRFELKHLKTGNYTLVISYPKMADYIRDVLLNDGTQLELGNVNMELKSNLLEEVQIKAAKTAMSRKGDTLVYQADSFKVAEHANLQELLRRLPGIEVDINGKIKAQGKEVNRLLVDGDEFFGDDPLMATQYLKAKGVAEVQVYDRKSREADLTGIDDGSRERTMNVKLKENAKNGYISDLDLKSSLFKYNDDGALAAVYVKKLKAAVFGQKTNLNLGNYASQSFGGFSTTYDTYYKVNSGDEGIPGSGENLYNNLNGTGLPDNLKFGGYFSGKWKTKSQATLNSNYFDNRNTNLQRSGLEELLPDGSIFSSQNSNTNSSRNTGSDLKAAVTLELDTSSSLTIDVRAKQNRNENNAGIDNRNMGNAGLLLSSNAQVNTGSGSADIFNGNINYVKKFSRKGRTLTVDLQPESKKGESVQNNKSQLAYYDNMGGLVRTDNLDLRKESEASQTSFAARLSFTEPLSQNFSLQAGYSFKGISSSSDKQTYNNVAQGSRIDSLSNDFQYNSFTNIGKAILQYKYQKLTASTGVELTQTNFALEDQVRANTYNRAYLNFAPNTTINFWIGGGKYLSLQYAGETRQPSINQLQPIREIDNPLYQVIGNPDLRPSFSNNFAFTMNKTNLQGASFSVTLNYNFSKNAIISTQTIDQFNKRVTSFLNVDGINAAALSLSYGAQVKGTGLYYNTGFRYALNQNVSLVNSVRNNMTNNNYALNGTLRYSLKNIYLTGSSIATLTKGSSSLGMLNSGRSLSHNHQLAANIKLPLKMEFNATAALVFQPANSSFDRSLNTYQVNSYLLKKLLKNQSLELKLSVNDLLNQQTGYNRTVYGNSISETTYSYIPRFFLIGLRWNMSGNFIINDKK